MDRTFENSLTFICILIVVVFTCFFYFFGEISNKDYESALVWSSEPSIFLMTKDAMIDGKITHSEFSDIEARFKYLESKKASLELMIKGNK